jgi:hypothetical protein
MGFAPAGEGRFLRDLSATGDVLRTHRNFARHLGRCCCRAPARARPLGRHERAAKIRAHMLGPCR